jgi:hypothetical protein
MYYFTGWPKLHQVYHEDQFGESDMYDYGFIMYKLVQDAIV